MARLPGPGEGRVNHFLLAHYDLARGLHIIAVIAWVAGLLYLPRLFVYHFKSTPGSETDELFKLMERRVLKGILNPAMVVAYLFGAWLIWIDGNARGWGFLLKPWMLTKIAGIVFQTGWHHFLALKRKAFERGERPYSERFWRMTNELPFLAAIVMVLAVTTEFGG
jgi:putative membrane protein